MKQNSINVFIGSGLSNWLKTLFRNRFRVSLKKLPVAIIITVVSFFNSVLFWTEYVLLGFWVSRVRIQEPPVFILGHWRSGTTLVYELFNLDKRNVCPKTWDCFAANHFLLTGWLLKPLFSLLLPAKRPQDNMAVAMDLPQEDECALGCLGAPAPYMHFLFPDSRETYFSLYDIEQQDEKAQKKWQRTYLWFVKRLLFQNPGRFVSKSPTHTFRIKTLLKLFPDARFVHIFRNPFDVFQSTMKLYQSMYREYHVGAYSEAGLDDFVIRLYAQMDRKFEQTRQLIPKDHYCQLYYEDLVEHPDREMRRLYQTLNLGDYDASLARALKAYFDERVEYRKNRLKQPSALPFHVRKRLAFFADKHGYDTPEKSGQHRHCC